MNNCNELDNFKIVEQRKITSEFKQWLKNEDGLVDLKFSLSGSADEKTVSRSVIKEFLLAEKMIDAGIIDDHLEHA